MTMRRLVHTLFNPGQHKRPEIDAMLNMELERHNDVVRRLVTYAREHETEQTGRADGEAGTA